MAKKVRNILTKDTEFSVALKQKHPRGKMKLGGVDIYGGAAQNYTIPKGTDLTHDEVEAWFVIKNPVKGAVNAQAEADKKASEELKLKEAADLKEKEDKAKQEKALNDQILEENAKAAQKEIDDAKLLELNKVKQS